MKQMTENEEEKQTEAGFTGLVWFGWFMSCL